MKHQVNIGSFSRLLYMLFALVTLVLSISPVMAETRTAAMVVKPGFEVYKTGPHRGTSWHDGFGRFYTDCRDPKDTRNINYACGGQIKPSLQANEIITSSSINGLTLTTEIKTCPDAVDRGAPPFTNQQCVSGCPVGQYHRVGSDNTCYPIRVLVSPPFEITKNTLFPISADTKSLPARMGCDMYELKRASITGGGVTLLSTKLVNTPATGCSVTLELAKPTDVNALSTVVIEVAAKGVVKTHTLTVALPIPVL